MDRLLILAILLSVPAMLVTYPAYFVALAAFRRAFRAHHEVQWQDVLAECRRTELESTFAVLQESRRGSFRGVALHPQVESARRAASRWLHAGATSFLVFMFAWLIRTVGAEMA